MPKNKLNQGLNSDKTERWNVSSVRALIGLGNAGAEYENTYHNVGLMVVDWLRQNCAQEKTAAPKEVNHVLEYYKEGGLVWIKSLIFMNESGVAVKKALDYFNLRPSEILIIHDDSDLEIGRIKLSWDRGSAGHKGVESVISRLGTKKLWRLRIGIRSPSKILCGGTREGKRERASKFVLKKIGKKNAELLTRAVKNIAEILGLAGD